MKIEIRFKNSDGEWKGSFIRQIEEYKIENNFVFTRESDGEVNWFPFCRIYSITVKKDD
jgi:hypothetical protein